MKVLAQDKIKSRSDEISKFELDDVLTFLKMTKQSDVGNADVLQIRAIRLVEMKGDDPMIKDWINKAMIKIRGGKQPFKLGILKNMVSNLKLNQLMEFLRAMGERASPTLPEAKQEADRLIAAKQSPADVEKMTNIVRKIQASWKKTEPAGSSKQKQPSTSAASSVESEDDEDSDKTNDSDDDAEEEDDPDSDDTYVGNDDDRFEDGFDEDCIGDEKDRAMLAKLPEKEREAVILKRLENRQMIKRKRAKERRAVAEKQNSNLRRQTRSLSSKSTSSQASVSVLTSPTTLTKRGFIKPVSIPLVPISLRSSASSSSRTTTSTTTATTTTAAASQPALSVVPMASFTFTRPIPGQPVQLTSTASGMVPRFQSFFPACSSAVSNIGCPTSAQQIIIDSVNRLLTAAVSQPLAGPFLPPTTCGGGGGGGMDPMRFRLPSATATATVGPRIRFSSTPTMAVRPFSEGRVSIMQPLRHAAPMMPSRLQPILPAAVRHPHAAATPLMPTQREEVSIAQRFHRAGLVVQGQGGPAGQNPGPSSAAVAGCSTSRSGQQGQGGVAIRTPFMPTPFCDVVSELLVPTPLAPMSSDLILLNVNFKISATELANLRLDSSVPYEVVLRIALNCPRPNQELDDFPPQMKISMNSKPVGVPTNYKLNDDRKKDKRVGLPLFLTDYVDIKASQSLVIMGKSEANKLSKTRIVVPARGTNCKHLQCFDLKNFLSMNETRKDLSWCCWSCPVCNKQTMFEALLKDEYVGQILDQVSADVTEVEVQKDSSWLAVGANHRPIAAPSDADAAAGAVCLDDSADSPQVIDIIDIVDDDSNEPALEDGEIASEGRSATTSPESATTHNADTASETSSSCRQTEGANVSNNGSLVSSTSNDTVEHSDDGLDADCVGDFEDRRMLDRMNSAEREVCMRDRIMRREESKARHRMQRQIELAAAKVQSTAKLLAEKAVSRTSEPCALDDGPTCSASAARNEAAGRHAAVAAQPVPVLDFLYEAMTSSQFSADWLWADFTKQMTGHELDHFSNAIKGMEVELCFQPLPGGSWRTAQVIDVTRVAANSEFLSCPLENQGSEMVNVPEYFARKHRITLQYPNLPCLYVDKSVESISVPLELCSICPTQRVSDRAPVENQRPPRTPRLSSSHDSSEVELIDLVSDSDDDVMIEDTPQPGSSSTAAPELPRAPDPGRRRPVEEDQSSPFSSQFLALADSGCDVDAPLPAPPPAKKPCTISDIFREALEPSSSVIRTQDSGGILAASVPKAPSVPVVTLYDGRRVVTLGESSGAASASGAGPSAASSGSASRSGKAATGFESWLKRKSSDTFAAQRHRTWKDARAEMEAKQRQATANERDAALERARRVAAERDKAKMASLQATLANARRIDAQMTPAERAKADQAARAQERERRMEEAVARDKAAKAVEAAGSTATTTSASGAAAPSKPPSSEAQTTQQKLAATRSAVAKQVEERVRRLAEEQAKTKAKAVEQTRRIQEEAKRKATAAVSSSTAPTTAGNLSKGQRRRLRREARRREAAAAFNASCASANHPSSSNLVNQHSTSSKTANQQSTSFKTANQQSTSSKPTNPPPASKSANQQATSSKPANPQSSSKPSNPALPRVQARPVAETAIDFPAGYNLLSRTSPPVALNASGGGGQAGPARPNSAPPRPIWPSSAYRQPGPAAPWSLEQPAMPFMPIPQQRQPLFPPQGNQFAGGGPGFNGGAPPYIDWGPVHFGNGGQLPPGWQQPPPSWPGQYR